MVCCFPEKKNNKAVVWNCIPLAVFAILFAALQTGWPFYSIIAETQADRSEQRIAGTVSYIFNGLQMIFGLMELASVFSKWLPGLKFYDSSLQFLVLTWICYIIVMIGLLFMKKEEYVGISKSHVSTSIIITLVGAVILFVLAFFMRSCSASLIKVVECGGTGFEKLNYKQLKTGVERRAFTRNDSDTDTISDFNAEP